MNSINECVLELCLFFDVVLGTLGPSLYKSAGHLNIILKSYIDVVLRTLGPSLYKSAGHLNIILKSYIDVVLGTFGPLLCLTL